MPSLVYFCRISFISNRFFKKAGNTMNSIQRKLRYKDLLDQGSELRMSTNFNDGVNNTVNQVSHIISESNKLNEMASSQDHANNTTEAVMDAQVMKMGHELLGSVINKIGCSEFLDAEFFTAIIGRVFTSTTENWDDLAQIGIKVARTSTFTPCLLGSLKHDPAIIVKPLTERRRKKTTHSQLLRPEDVSKLEKQDKGAQKLNLVLNQIRKIFTENNEQPIPYYKLIIDPDSIMKTIDNSFQVAFLISNGSIAMESDVHGLPAIKPLRRDKSDRSTVISVQAASNITTTICKDMIKLYNIQQPILR